VVSREPFLHDTGMSARPHGLPQRVEVLWYRNIGPARKLLPVLRESRRGDLVVTADDDILYPTCWLDRIKETADLFPGDVLCFRARRLLLDRPYKRWRKVKRKRYLQSHRLLPIGVNGIAYRPGQLKEGVFDEAALLALAPRTDDLWFAAHRRPEVPVGLMRSPGAFTRLKHRKKLASQNIRIHNDEAVRAIVGRYGRMAFEGGWPEDTAGG
jgi:hypothetical protein